MPPLCFVEGFFNRIPVAMARRPYRIGRKPVAEPAAPEEVPASPPPPPPVPLPPPTLSNRERWLASASKEAMVALAHHNEATPKVWRTVKQSLAGVRNPSNKNVEVFFHLADLCGAVDELRARHNHRREVEQFFRLEAQRVQRLKDEAEKAEKAKQAAEEEEARVRSGALVAKRRKRYHQEEAEPVGRLERDLFGYPIGNGP